MSRHDLRRVHGPRSKYDLFGARVGPVEDRMPPWTILEMLSRPGTGTSHPLWRRSRTAPCGPRACSSRNVIVVPRREIDRRPTPLSVTGSAAAIPPHSSERGLRTVLWRSRNPERAFGRPRRDFAWGSDVAMLEGRTPPQRRREPDRGSALIRGTRGPVPSSRTRRLSSPPCPLRGRGRRRRVLAVPRWLGKSPKCARAHDAACSGCSICTQ